MRSALRFIPMAAAWALILPLGAATARAKPAIDVGEHPVAPGPNQVIRLYVHGGDPVQGLNLYAQIADTNVGPLFTDADVLTDTCFAGNNLGLLAGSYVDERWLYQGVGTDHDTVMAQGLLATLVLDATGLTVGERYALKLTSSKESGSSTHFAGVATQVTDGWIVVVPEPATGLLLLSLLTWVRRRRS